MSIIPVVALDITFVKCARDMLEREVFVASGRLQDSLDTRRTTYEFGYRYHELRKGNSDHTIIPDSLSLLCAMALERLASATLEKLPPAEAFTNCIISDYREGFKLQPHIDRNYTIAEKGYIQNGRERDRFYFGEYVVGVVLQADTTGRLYIEGGQSHEPHVLEEYAGAAFLLTGYARHKLKHGVSTVKKRRISATFRTVHFLDQHVCN